MRYKGDKEPIMWQSAPGTTTHPYVLFSQRNGLFKDWRWSILTPLFYLINELAWSYPAGWQTYCTDYGWISPPYL